MALRLLLSAVTRAVRDDGGYLDSSACPRLNCAGSAAIDPNHCRGVIAPGGLATRSWAGPGSAPALYLSLAGPENWPSSRRKRPAGAASTAASGRRLSGPRVGSAKARESGPLAAAVNNAEEALGMVWS